MNDFFERLKALGGEGLVAGFIIFALGLIVKDLAPKLLKAAADLGKWFWAKIRGRGDDRAFEKKYLNWLVAQHRHLGLLPAQVIARRWGERQQFVDLEDIYVQLSVSSKSEDEQWASSYGEGKSHWRKRPWIGLRLIRFVARLLMDFGGFKWLRKIEILTEPNYEQGDLGLVVDKYRRLIIRGDPGSGKTTFLRFLAVTCARPIRNDKSDGDSSRLVRKRLYWDKYPFPIVVTLSRHGHVENWGDKRGLIDAFVEEMPPELQRKCPPGFFERQLRDGDCLIMLDAFDELGTPEARGAMAQQIVGFLGVYDRPDNHIVVTTRIVGYEGQLDQYGFEIRTVQDLNAGQTRALIKHRYRAITVAETAGRHVQEAHAITERLQRRAESLIEKIESNPRLRQLATNPMLLSLIVLVHFLKVELPEERVLLYRDCVEILTERWQQAKHEQIGMRYITDKRLTLSQKLFLLREIAFAIQQRRQETSSQALIPKNAVIGIIAEKLPDLLGVESSESGEVKKESYLHQAESWLDGIQVGSGILVERGLDSTGEPLVGFSHLTFQEYLAAVAVSEVDVYQSSLWSNLLNPAWQEVVLLYVGLIDDPTYIIKALYEAPQQPEGILLAGHCLAEPLKRLDLQVQHEVTTKLQELFIILDEDRLNVIAEILGAMRSANAVDFLIDQARSGTPARQLSVVKTLGQTSEDSPKIAQIRDCLVGLLESESLPNITIAARESLARVGDPRFIGPDLEMVRIPRHFLGQITSLDVLKKACPASLWKQAKGFKERYSLVGRTLDYILFILHLTISQRRTSVYLDEFEISKYPVTNLEYNRFIEATDHKPPLGWLEGAYPTEKATHPVCGIHLWDVDAFCKWLSGRTGNTYRLPREWEWELAARGEEEHRYPWGDAFDQNLCNSKESEIDGTTPVGSYWKGNSPYGVSDLSGNVWEATTGLKTFSFLGYMYVFLTIQVIATTVYTIVEGSLFGFGIAFSFICYLMLRYMVRNSYVYRGGSWESLSSKCTCFYREAAQKSSGVANKLIGFRCIRDS